jgi:lysophospholipase L1-like esterase
MKLSLFLLFPLVAFISSVSAQDAAGKAAFMQKYAAAKAAPAAGACVLKKGDRLAICGDSITEQKMYSLLMETYLTVCTPELAVTCRQHGWSGEQAMGFARRMANDVLRFKPTVATSCYGMNDHRYVPYTEQIGADYRKSQESVAQQFQDAGVRYIIGAPGNIHTVPQWVKSAAGTWETLNLSLLQLRNIDVEIAEQRKIGFADTFMTMLEAGYTARQRHGEEFAIEGKDGVHPAWAGQVVMAYGFLKALGLSSENGGHGGEVGSFTWNIGAGTATASSGHTVVKADAESLTLNSTKLPILPGEGDVAKFEVMKAGFALVPFHETLNRFILTVPDASASSYTLTWGAESHDFTAAQLKAGVHLAKEFGRTPLDAVYRTTMEAIRLKQNFETKQMKEQMHGAAGKANMEGTVATTEKERDALVANVTAAFVPVEHTLTLKAK